MSTKPETPALKPLHWIGGSKQTLSEFPVPVRKEMGHALHLVQAGERPLTAKPLRGFGGAGVLELIENHEGNAYRAVYTIKFAKAVFVLHVFQKKSKKGIATPKMEIDLIRQRLKLAAARYRELFGDENQ